ncbi:MAG: DPP IV N-terminal domain-containing protein [Bacteroidota bacterium]
MPKFKLLLLLVPAMFSLKGLFAQDKYLSNDEAITGARTFLAPRNYLQYGFLNTKGKFFAIDTLMGTQQMLIGEADKKSLSPYVSLKELNKFLRSNKTDTLAQFPQWKLTGKEKLSCLLPPCKLLQCKTDEKKPAFSLRICKTPEAASNPEFSPDGNKVAFTLRNNLYLMQDTLAIPVSTENDPDIIYGQAVHRNEFGINKGIFWSPAGTYFAFYKMDQRMVKNYPITNWSEIPAGAENTKYPMAGDASHQVCIGIYAPLTRSVIYLQTPGEPDQYLTNISWSPDEKLVFVALLNRKQNHMQLMSFDVQTGKPVLTLIEERNEKYVEPQHPALFLNRNKDLFIWQSSADGFNHMYLYDQKGALVRRLSTGNWEVTKVLGVDADDRYVYFIANASSALNRDFCRSPINGGPAEFISTAEGTHNIKADADCKYFFDWYQSSTIPGILSVYNASLKPQVLIQSDNMLKSYVPVGMKLGSFTHAGNTLYYRLFTPASFDSTKKYPAIVYLYNGPHVQSVTNTWLGGAANLWFHRMAQQGYVVFTVDGRGSDNRGRDFEQATFRNLGVVESEDQLAGIEFLKKTGYVDEKRLGIFGWSYGGFMTTTLMTDHPGVFKAGVAGGPVIDWKWYEVMYTERYMDTPEENPEGYEKSSLLAKADKLKDRLLMIHGTDDDVVVWQHSLKFVKTCVSKGILLDYFVYPGHKHNVNGKDRVHLYNMVSRYFMDHL